MLVEIVDHLVEQAMPVDLGLEMQKDRAEADRGAVHEDKSARRRDAAQPANVAVDTVDEAAAVPGGRAAFPLLLDHPRTVIEQRAVNKGGPTVQDGDHLIREVAETPAAIGLDRQLPVVALQRVIESDDP